jgi:hypothetical protein
MNGSQTTRANHGARTNELLLSRAGFECLGGASKWNGELLTALLTLDWHRDDERTVCRGTEGLAVCRSASESLLKPG